MCGWIQSFWLLARCQITWHAETDTYGTEMGKVFVAGTSLSLFVSKVYTQTEGSSWISVVLVSPGVKYGSWQEGGGVLIGCRCTMAVCVFYSQVCWTAYF